MTEYRIPIGYLQLLPGDRLYSRALNSAEDGSEDVLQIWVTGPSVVIHVLTSCGTN